jgi:ATP/maltotriose-dependent transcriptional regulator MalT
MAQDAHAASAAIRRMRNLVTAKLLPAYIEIALVAGDVQEARSASAELGEIAGRYATDVLRAMAAHARGAVELAEGRTQVALSTLRHAFELWQQGEAPYETACVPAARDRMPRTWGHRAR